MDWMTVEGREYISTTKATEFSGYTKDYVGQLCRKKKVLATRVGRNWYVDKASLLRHKNGQIEKGAEDRTTFLSPQNVPEVAHNEVRGARIARTLSHTEIAPRYTSDDTPLFPQFSRQKEHEIKAQLSPVSAQKVVSTETPKDFSLFFKMNPLFSLLLGILALPALFALLDIGEPLISDDTLARAGRISERTLQGESLWNLERAAKEWNRIVDTFIEHTQTHF